METRTVTICHDQKPHMLCKIRKTVDNSVIWEGWFRGYCDGHPTTSNFVTDCNKCRFDVTIPIVPITIEFYAIHPCNPSCECLRLSYQLTEKQIASLVLIDSHLGNFHNYVELIDDNHKVILIESDEIIKRN